MTEWLPQPPQWLELIERLCYIVLINKPLDRINTLKSQHFLDRTTICNHIDTVVNNVSQQSRNVDQDGTSDWFSQYGEHAGDEVIFVSDTLNDHVFSQFIVPVCQNLAEHGTVFKLHTGNHILSSKNKHPFLDECINRAGFEFYIREDRPPALHYVLINSSLMIIEAIHYMGASERNYFVIDDEIVNGLLRDKFYHCIKNDRKNKPASSSDLYKKIEEIPEEYLESYNNALSPENIQLAQDNPKQWLKKYLLTEYGRQYHSVLAENNKDKFDGSLESLKSIFSFNCDTEKVVNYIENNKTLTIEDLKEILVNVFEGRYFPNPEINISVDETLSRGLGPMLLFTINSSLTWEELEEKFSDFGFNWWYNKYFDLMDSIHITYQAKFNQNICSDKCGVL